MAEPIVKAAYSCPAYQTFFISLCFYLWYWLIMIPQYLIDSLPHKRFNHEQLVLFLPCWTRERNTGILVSRPFEQRNAFILLSGLIIAIGIIQYTDWKMSINILTPIIGWMDIKAFGRMSLIGWRLQDAGDGFRIAENGNTTSDIK